MLPDGLDSVLIERLRVLHVLEQQIYRHMACVDPFVVSVQLAGEPLRGLQLKPAIIAALDVLGQLGRAVVTQTPGGAFDNEF